MVYTQEANEESERIMQSPLHYVSVEGDLIRDIGNESYQCMYNMTKYADQKRKGYYYGRS